MILGLSDKEIATLTGTATTTVHAIASHIYKKLNVHNRREAVSAYLGFDHAAPSRIRHLT